MRLALAQACTRCCRGNKNVWHHMLRSNHQIDTHKDYDLL